jgi:hypothetical protein
MSARPYANATYAAVVAAYREVIDNKGLSPRALSEHYEAMAGHLSSHVLDFAGGNRTAMTFFEARDNNPNSASPDLVLLVLYCDEGMEVYVYDPTAFDLSPERADDAEYDCGLMLTADPARMDEMDAFGAFFQFPTRNLCEFIPW